MIKENYKVFKIGNVVFDIKKNSDDRKEKILIFVFVRD